MRNLDIAALQAAINSDPEFKLAARHLTLRLKMDMDDAKYLFHFVQGVLTRIQGEPLFLEEWDVIVSGPADGWSKLLQPTPPPFYQDLFSAHLRQGFELGGDLESLFAYYPAISRLFVVFRQLVKR